MKGEGVGVERRTSWWFVISIRYMGLCQAVAVAKKDLMVVCNGYQLCGVIPNSNRGKDGTGGGL